CVCVCVCLSETLCVKSNNTVLTLLEQTIPLRNNQPRRA
uniref:Uncharacterized protein n=1 Tax=Anopheles quadriannulatus TaxID=34691 RepID=A0A182XR52_ANOQN